MLIAAPVPWTPDFWADSANAWGWVTPETPLDAKPWAELEVSLDVTLVEVCEAACEAWGIKLGNPRYETTLRNQFQRFAFVRRSDEDGVAEQRRYEWPDKLPIAREDGTVELVFGGDVTYRELLASSSLGLIEGDVRRPYVDPVIPQGELETAVELTRHTVEAIRAAYSGVEETASSYAEHTLRLIRASFPDTHRVAGEVVDDAVRVFFLVGAYRWLRKKLRRQPPQDPGAG